jgi:soluble lytic murein transglycosylase-like protein
MSKSAIPRPRILWQIGVVGAILWAGPSNLWGQETSSSQLVPAATGEQFAGFDASLTRAADALLNPATPSTSPAIGTPNVVQAPIISLAQQKDEGTSPWAESGLTAAALRMNLLRPIVEPILKSHGVPADLVAVVLVESGGRATALSPKGARGLWQLMPDTARHYGLRVDDMQDDRLDLFKATDAAARYLHDLFAQFGDWRLALAAYNTGEANVGSAILRAHTQDFDQLINLRMLPVETRNYVPRVLAAAPSIGQPSAFGNRHDTPSVNTVFAVTSR